MIPLPALPSPPPNNLPIHARRSPKRHQQNPHNLPVSKPTSSINRNTDENIARTVDNHKRVDELLVSGGGREEGEEGEAVGGTEYGVYAEGEGYCCEYVCGDAAGGVLDVWGIWGEM